jgi:undecaprenyl-diphosphatase
MTSFESIVIGIVEGLTEFLPVSSTGHMIITEKLLHLADNDFLKTYTVAIQLGAILAVVVMYRKLFLDFRNPSFYIKLFIGVIPALVLGALFSKKIDLLLESPQTVAISLFLGGVFFLFIDKIFNSPAKTEETTYQSAFMIGLFQCLAMIPGVSRSAASIIGGMQQGLSRSNAAEFSFFLAVPTMAAATGYKLLSYFKDHGSFTGDEWKVFAIGNVVAFVTAMLAIRFFISFVKKYGFSIWGWYRISLAIFLFILIYSGVIQ